ncbi:MAG: hypothetical protein WC867_05275 [Candidatus Pacearchaeota archaeon]|jgi:hypothetical protein
MSTIDPLYEDDNIRIEDFLASPNLTSFYFISNNNIISQYFIPKDKIKEIANSNRSVAKSLITSLDKDLLFDAKNKGLSIDYLGLSIASAYRELEKRLEISFEKTIESVLFEE